MFCQATGYGGTANESNLGGGEALVGLHAVGGSRLLTIEFTSDVSPNLAWKFEPAQRFVRVQPGETALAFYEATNSHAEPITGISTYNVSPQKAGLYFHKIQCFCFEEQRLLSGETIDMPVFFYIDPDFADDPKMDDVNTVTLSYTFFKSSNQEFEEEEAEAEQIPTKLAGAE